jgi:hypothetical protein
MTTTRIIYYYQTFIGLDDLLAEDSPSVTHIILSSIHFGIYPITKKPYIHLNDHVPEDVRFKIVWEQLEELSQRGVVILLMIGGAGGAYSTLFENEINYQIYLQKLIDVLCNFSFIQGIELDVEETVDPKNLQKFLRDIEKYTTYQTTSNFIYTMAPIAESLLTDTPGLGGFRYKDFLSTPEGSWITWLNVQCYFSFSEETYEKLIQAGFAPEFITMGMINSEFTSAGFSQCLNIINALCKKYPLFGGVDIWEYDNSPPDTDNPAKWSQLIQQVINENENKNKNTCVII